MNIRRQTSRVSLILASLHAAAFGQITILSTPWPTSADLTTLGDLWPGGLISIVTTGLSVTKPVVRSHKDKLPLELAGIRVKVGIGQYRCRNGFDSNPAGAGLDAPIIDVADHGDRQQVTVQVPWEYVRYPQQPTGGTVCQGANQVSVSQGGVTATSAVNGDFDSPHLFLDADGYVLAQHESDLSWVTAAKPAHPGERIILQATNLGWVANPPPTGHLTPQLVPAVISVSNKTQGPFLLDTSRVNVGLLLTYDTYYPAPGAEINVAMLLPGAVGRYHVPIQLAPNLPASKEWTLTYFWLDCAAGKVQSAFACPPNQLQTAHSNVPMKIHLVSP